MDKDQDEGEEDGESGWGSYTSLLGLQCGWEINLSPSLCRGQWLSQSWSSLRFVMNFGGQQYLASIFHRASRLIESKTKDLC